MNKTCQISQEVFEVSKEDLDFYEKIGVEVPKLSPDERRRRRFAFRNERFLYKRKSDFSGKEIISCVHPDEPHKVYSTEEWWSDDWDAIDSGIDFDFDRPFFEQFEEVFLNTPMIALHVVNTQNCPYVNYTGDCKNCHMIFGPVYSDDCLYGSPYYCKSCVDSLLVRDSELCYECVTCEKCYQCLHCQDCVNSQNLIQCYDCKGCHDCIGSCGLRNKKFHIFNKPYSQDDYEKFKKTLDLSDKEQMKDLRKKFIQLKLSLPHRAMVSVNIENCTGDYLYESKNTHEAYDSQRCWDCKHLAQTIDMKDCYDCNYTEENELCYEYIGYYRNNNCQFSLGFFNCNNVMYSSNCISSNNLFGCAGLKRKEYCIFNKQYSKEEYKELRGRIIEHMKKTCEWSEFFPVKMSPFCYNETVANEYFPMDKEEALEREYRWRKKDPKEYLAPHDDILACSECEKNYKLLPAEVKFYGKAELGHPDKCPDCRHKDRLGLRTERKLWDRKCAKCEAAMKTTYSDEKPEIIYCEKCYLESVH